ncbi:hypothetical protein RhiLY_01429 [Ceratobasidium sp. AG-Ba]|nr:hypothetical protein RhiLY_01429 [Ceratobasidium sp. AG-Ba]
MQPSNSIRSQKDIPEERAYISYQPTSSSEHVRDDSGLAYPSQLSEIATTPEFSTPDSDEIPAENSPTKRDKLAGKVGRILAKVTRDPELRDRAMMQETGGKDLADGLEIVDSSTI